MHVIVYASVCEFRGRNSFLVGKNVKPRKNGKNSKIIEMVQGSLKFFQNLG